MNWPTFYALAGLIGAASAATPLYELPDRYKGAYEVDMRRAGFCPWWGLVGTVDEPDRAFRGRMDYACPEGAKDFVGPPVRETAEDRVRWGLPVGGCGPWDQKRCVVALSRSKPRVSRTSDTRPTSRATSARR